MTELCNTKFVDENIAKGTTDPRVEFIYIREAVKNVLADFFR